VFVAPDDMISEFGTQYMAKMQECTKR